MAGACGTCRHKRNMYILLVGKPKGKRPIGRPRLQREKNIKVSMEGRGLDSSGTGHTKVTVSCKFGNELLDSIK